MVLQESYGIGGTILIRICYRLGCRLGIIQPDADGSAEYLVMKTGRISRGIGICQSPAEISANQYITQFKAGFGGNTDIKSFIFSLTITNRQVLGSRLINICGRIIGSDPVLIGLGNSENKSKIRPCAKVKFGFPGFSKGELSRSG